MDVMTQVEVDASVGALWDVVADVRDWPRWTTSVDAVTVLGLASAAPDAARATADARPPEKPDAWLALGSRAAVTQPRLGRLVWTVTALEPGRSFIWEARSAGVVTTGSHEVEAVGDTRSRLTLRLTQRGPLAGLVGLLLGRRSRHYVALEAAGLAAAAEARHSPPTH